MPKTSLEKIAGYDEQITQLMNRKKQEMQKHKQAERKARDHRLIQRGAILESLIPNPEIYTNDEIKVFLKKTVGSSFAKRVLAELKPAKSQCPTSIAEQ